MKATKYLPKSFTGWAILAGAGVVIYGSFKAKKAAAAVTEVIKTDLNPASDENLAYTGVNSIGALLTDDQDFSLGSKIYDWVN